jgi:DNA-binding NarL/FixJ family response regulator
MTAGPGVDRTLGQAAIRVLVADDHPLFRSGLRAMVEDAEGLEFVGEARDGQEALALCRVAPPNVVLMDLRMPGTSGVAATAALAAELPEVRVLMLTMLEDDTSLVAALRAGARGYVLKGAAPDETLRAIRAVAVGQAIFGVDLADRLAGLATGWGGQRPYPFPELSCRERDVLELMAAGHANPVIATRLDLSEKTVRNNVSAVLVKLRAADRPAAVVRAREAGIASPYRVSRYGLTRRRCSGPMPARRGWRELARQFALASPCI